LATRVAEASHPEEAMEEETVVGMEVPMDTTLPQMLQLAQVVFAAAATVGLDTAEEVMVDLACQIEITLACQCKLVGMTRVAAVAHMMTDPADIVAAAVADMATVVVIIVQEAVATWSR